MNLERAALILNRTEARDVSSLQSTSFIARARCRLDELDRLPARSFGETMSIHAWFQKILELHMRRIIARFYRSIVVVSVALTALAVFVIATRWNIDSDLNALLPEQAPAAKAMREVSDRVGAGSSLFVVVDSPDRQANLDFAADYTAKLEQMPEIALAHYHNDKSFFEKNKLLYMERDDIAALRERVEKTIKQRKREANPLFVSLKPRKKKKADEALAVRGHGPKYARQMAHRNYKEYLFSDDGYALTIIVRFVESSTDLNSTNALIDRVRSMADELDPESYNAEMTIDFGGGLASRQKQYNSIVDDIKTSAIFTLLGLFLLLSFYFRRPRAVVTVSAPLLMGVSWTLAIAFLLYGQLTAITVFIFAILLGLGIDFSIHMLHGYDRGRADGLDPVEALAACATTTGLATTVGGLTTLATFLVLTMANFKSLSQFGVVASIGVVATLVATIITMPAMVLTFQWLKPHEVAHVEATDRRRERLDAFLATWLKRLAPVTLVAAVIFTAVAAGESRHMGFEENFYRFGNFYWPWEDAPDIDKYERERGTRVQAHDVAKSIAASAEAVRERVSPETYVRERLQKTTGDKYTSALQNKTSSTPTILLFDNPNRAEETALKAREYPSISSISSIYDFLPGTKSQQQERLDEIERLRGVLEKEDLDFLEGEEKKRVEDLRKLLEVKPVDVKDLPEWTKRFFKEAGPHAKQAKPGEPFAYEYLLIATPRQRSLNGPQARLYLDDLEHVVGSPEKGDFRLASQAYVYTTMLDEIQTDGLRMISIAIGVVFLILLIAFRRPGKAALAMFPLVVGGVWMFGICSLLNLKLDFFNIIILPALIGIGVDDGVHFTMRYFELGEGSLPEVLRDVGSAVWMTSLTSLIGFGGLAITNYRGLQSLGQLAIVGIICALFATVLVLPSLLWAIERLRARSN
jgi:predicted RND superfamily exporter protein